MTENFKKALLFDWDGTLVDSKGTIPALLPPYFKEFFGWEVEVERILRYFNNGWKDQIKKIARDMGAEVTAEQMDEFAEVTLRMKRETRCPLLPGVRELLQEAKERGVRLALCSNNLRRDLDELVRVHELEGVFQIVVGQDEVKDKKPAGDMFLKAARELGVSARHCIVVEDSSTGVKAAQAADMTVLAVATGIQGVDELERYEPTRVVGSLGEIGLDEVLNLR